MTDQTPPSAAEPRSLRHDLVEAGMALLEEGGIQGLTLRRAAARAGVSHAAPAHHFAGLPGLLTAIAAAAFQRFAAAMSSALALAPDAPAARLQAVCAGYLAFAADHAGLFHVMFQSPEVRRDDPELLPHSRLAYDLLRQTCLPYSVGGQPDPTFEVAVWSLVHGYATLGFQAQVGQGRGVLTVPPFADCLANLIAHRPLGPLAAAPQMG